MIDLYTAATPNGQKAAIMLEEVGLPYKAHIVDLSKGTQKEPDYLAVNPNGKIPAIVDRDGPGGTPVTVFESGAILVYLAEKVGALLPAEPTGRFAALEWLMFQMAGVGPMFGQAGFWTRSKESVPAALARYKGEAERLTGVLERRLGEAPYLAGPDYLIADIATWLWIGAAGFIGLDLQPYPVLRDWHARIGERPAVQRGMALAPRSA